MVRWSSSTAGVSDLGDLADKEGAAKGKACSWSSGSSAQMQGPEFYFPQEEKKQGPLLKPFIRCDLGKLTITCLSTCKMLHVTGLCSKYEPPNQGSHSLRL